MSEKTEYNRKKLTLELALDPEDIGYAAMSDREVITAFVKHKVVERLGFFIYRQFPLMDEKGKPILHDTGEPVLIKKRFTDVVRVDHIARFRKK